MYPERIICLAAEVPDILYRLGALDRVVGVSVYTRRPAQALSLPKVSGFRHGRAAAILRHRPDLVILTSTVQGPLAAELAGHGVPLLHLFPHRLADLPQTIRLLGNVVNRPEQAEAVVADLESTLEAVAEAAAALPAHPRVYFEEWMEPLVCGTGWVSDLIELAGGRDVFRDRAISGRRADDRRVDPDEVLRHDPDIIIASWCGKPLEPEVVQRRPGWDGLTALRRQRLIEWAPDILQCGPDLAMTARQLQGLMADVARDLAGEP